MWSSLVLIGQYLQMLESKHSQIWQIFDSRADNSDSSGPIGSIIELIRALVVIYILSTFGDDWLIFVDARVLTSKLWMDGHRLTVSDHNSSLSTPCSCELKKKRLLYLILFTQSLSSANIDQSAPNLVKIFMSSRI